jgi:hypothetical protein
MERKYTIQKTSELNKVDFEKIIEDSEETVRYNFDKSLFVYSWYDDTPEFQSTMTNNVIFNNREIKNIVNGWGSEYSNLTGNTIN